MSSANVRRVDVGEIPCELAAMLLFFGKAAHSEMTCLENREFPCSTNICEFWAEGLESDWKID
jgi:hypothetical protein